MVGGARRERGEMALRIACFSGGETACARLHVFRGNKGLKHILIGPAGIHWYELVITMW